MENLSVAKETQDGDAPFTVRNGRHGNVLKGNPSSLAISSPRDDDDDGTQDGVGDRELAVTTMTAVPCDSVGDITSRVKENVSLNGHGSDKSWHSGEVNNRLGCLVR
ncbi:hypothetical protein TIFTF001_042235 [Ficus carica]|uniref:Uncharacterized protein n=1 Tax=Ficus carica TaxID=3494 RepID=A0AA87ZLG9_FICCA|nr:hypothetical protein TIFTF001_042235 [Ficus carica]